MPGKKGKGGNQGGNQGGNPNQQKGGDFKFEFGASGKPEGLTKETQAALLPVLQQRLDKLIGVDSGYLDTLPQSVQKRIKALKKIQEKHDDLEDEFKKEMDALEKKYDDLKKPLYVRRSDIVNGKSEPTSEELAGTEEVKKEGEKKDAKDDVKGIPEFWLTALKHYPETEQMIQAHDEPVLKHLVDVRVVYLDDAHNSFAIEFAFDTNEHFDNKVLSKSFTVQSDKNGTMLDKIDGTEINWKQGKNITVKMVTKKQGGGGRGGRGGRGGKGGKGGNQGGKTVTVEEPQESFFHFFDSIDMDMFEDEEEAEEILEQDYEMGMMIREQLISDAINWFTGEAAAELGMFGDDEDDDEGDMDDEDDDDDEAPVKGGKGGRKGTAQLLKEAGDEDDDENDEEYDPKNDPKAAAQPECKQQ